MSPLCSVDSEHAIAILEYRGAVGDEEDGAVAYVGRYALEKTALGVGVQGAGGLVEQEYGAGA